MSHPKSFKDLQDQWYQKLNETGFVDIESVRQDSRPLREWHSFKIPSEKFQLIRASRALYQRQVDDFINHPSFTDACKYMVSHGNSKFTITQVELIWEMHAQGATRREIASELNRVKARIDDIIEGLREWMKLAL